MEGSPKEAAHQVREVETEVQPGCLGPMWPHLLPETDRLGQSSEVMCSQSDTIVQSLSISGNRHQVPGMA